MPKNSDFTPHQRTAVVAAVGADMSAPEVAAAAAAGELGDLDAFSISASSISAFAQEDRAEREDARVFAGSEERARVRALDHRLLDLAERLVAELEAADELDVSRLRQAAGLLKSIRAATVPPGSGGQASGAQQSVVPLLTRLAAEETARDAQGTDNGEAA